MEKNSVRKILKKHESLRDGSRVIYYDNDAFKEIVEFLRAAYESEKLGNAYYDYAFDYRPWNDGVHASCFVSWCDCEGIIFYEGFDCYV